MNNCSVFQLNILRSGLDCNFLLTWGERQQLTAKLKYAEELDVLYREWQDSYRNSYNSSTRGSIEDNFEYTPEETDWQNQLEQTEKALLTKFQQWLGSAELLNIRQTIQSEVINNTNVNIVKRNKANCVDLLIACNSPELEKLPWEAWDILHKSKNVLSPQIHISRTIINAKNEAISINNNLRRGKPRIFVILLAENYELDIYQDRKAIHCLKKVADVQIVQYQPGEDVNQFKQQLLEQLIDDRGWDALIYAGHSEETELTGGRLKLAPNIFLSLTEIESQLITAKNQGLRFALFNSCEGLTIAHKLIEFGLHQVVVMREKIHDKAAHPFLEKFARSLANYQTVQQALQETCQYFVDEKNSYPGASLIPSLFCHPSSKSELFYIERLGLKRWWRDWKPTKQEAIVLGITLLMSSPIFYPVSDLLLESRILTQSIYRNISTSFSQPKPPVYLIAIDSESIDKIKIKDGFKYFNSQFIDRRYLAILVNKINSTKSNIVGIDYVLDKEKEYQERLNSEIKRSVVENKTWFVFAKNNDKRLKTFSKTASPKFTLEGNANFFFWDIELPLNKNNQLDHYPFAYLLALSYKLKTTANINHLPQPNLDTKSTFKNQLNKWILNHNSHEIFESLQKLYSPFGWRSIIDFSIPPQQVYYRKSAWQFLETPHSQMKGIKDKIVIIAAGGYSDATDNYRVPLAVKYWNCDFLRKKTSKSEQFKQNNCRDIFTEGETHAYMIYQILSEHRVTLVPDFWLIILSAIYSKWINLLLLRLNYKKRSRTFLLILLIKIYF